MPREIETVHSSALGDTAPPQTAPKAKAKAASKPKNSPKTTAKAKTAKAAKAAPKPKASKRAPRRKKETWTARRKKKEIIPIVGVQDAPVGYGLLVLAHMYSTEMGNALHGNPATSTLTVPQLQTLHLLSENHDACGAELAKAMCVQPQTMTSVTNSLRAKGLITDLVAVPGQGRANLMVLTPAGREMLDAGRQAVEKVDAKLAHAYQEPEYKVLSKLLEMGYQELYSE